jgi:hypothetical protein
MACKLVEPSAVTPTASMTMLHDKTSGLGTI